MWASAALKLLHEWAHCARWKLLWQLHSGVTYKLVQHLKFYKWQCQCCLRKKNWNSCSTEVFCFFFFVFLNLAQKTTRPSWRHRSHLTLQLGPVCTNVNDTLWSLAGDDIYLFDGAICDIFTALCQSMSSINICSVKTKNNCFDVTNRKKDPRLHTRRNNNIDQQEAGPLNVHNPRKELCDFLTRVEKSMHELNSLFNNSRSSNSSVPPQHFHGIFKV